MRELHLCNIAINALFKIYKNEDFNLKFLGTGKLCPEQSVRGIG
jgi:hypothetical protein